MTVSRRELLAASAALASAAAAPAQAQAPAVPAPTGANVKPKLSTHVLDTYSGRPGVGIRIDFSELPKDAAPKLIKTVTTNADGRTDQLLLTAEEMRTGRFELAFHIGDYYRGLGLKLPDILFLDVVPIRFGIFDEKQGYHVPLLCTPWSYNTYRGS